MLPEKELVEVAHRSVLDLHVWIQDVFTGSAEQEASLEKLINSFCPSFTMVTTSGSIADKSQVDVLFRQNKGTRPSLSILIEQCETLLINADSVVLSYREIHQEAEKNSSRSSVVIIDIKDGKPLWRYLQETAQSRS
ncbi:hypothetical protein I6M53_12435 [Shewanella algae]|uniref:hypothetical protein n=1 Tax=Shewanella algae TaxID=38313 RepID=UPI001AACAFFF|nr:hypothetical protein [Shewanella algae]MBO2675463.1 hypothetical protein [Shewanella algae]